jgi:hypothetical protein
MMTTGAAVSWGNFHEVALELARDERESQRAFLDLKFSSIRLPLAPMKGQIGSQSPNPRSRANIGSRSKPIS